MEVMQEFFKGRLTVKSLSDEERWNPGLGCGGDSEICFDNSYTCFSLFHPDSNYARFSLFEGKRYAALHEGFFSTTDGEKFYCPRHINLTERASSETNNLAYWRRSIKDVALILIAMEARVRFSGISKIKTLDVGAGHVASKILLEIGYSPERAEYHMLFEKVLNTDNFVLPKIMR
jgi:hypothetical protein